MRVVEGRRERERERERASEREHLEFGDVIVRAGVGARVVEHGVEEGVRDRAVGDLVGVGRAEATGAVLHHERA